MAVPSRWPGAAMLSHPPLPRRKSAGMVRFGDHHNGRAGKGGGGMKEEHSTTKREKIMQRAKKTAQRLRLRGIANGDPLYKEAHNAIMALLGLLNQEGRN